MVYYSMDCINLPKLTDVTFMYIDPPYGPVNEDKYYGVGDNLRDYLYWLELRLRKLTLGLNNFNFIIHVDPKCGHYVKVMCDSIFGRKHFKNEIIWCYSGPSVAKHNFPRKHDCLYYYGVGKTVFNEQRIPYKALSSAKGSSWGGIENIQEYLARGKLLEDWWIDIPALQRNEKEKVGYATQKPSKLADRLVKTFSNVGDLVVDPMMGSGTIGKACKKLGRKFIGCDIKCINAMDV